MNSTYHIIHYTTIFFQSLETVASVMRRPYYMDATRAKEFGVIDKVNLTLYLERNYRIFKGREIWESIRFNTFILTFVSKLSCNIISARFDHLGL